MKHWLTKLAPGLNISRLALFALGVILFTFGFSLFTAAPAQATINEQLTFQARLYTADGGIVPDGNYNLEFKIYSGGDGDPGTADETLEWTETRQNSGGNGVRVENGYFNVRLGSVTALPADIWNNDTLWLSLNVGGTGTGSTPAYDGEMSPFTRLTAVPQAFNADKLDGIDSTQFARTDQNETFNNNVTIQGSTTVGTSSSLGQLTLHDGNGQTGLLQTANLGGNRTYTLPDSSGTVCLTTGNCTGGSGGGAPYDATYLTLTNDGDLANERLLAAGTNLAATDGGANNNYTLNVVDNPTFAGNLTVQGGTATFGQAGTQGQLTLHDGGATDNIGTLQVVSSLAQDTTFTLPDPGATTANICLDTGNCDGAGSSITGSGADNQVAIFNGSQSLDSSSSLTFDGTNFDVGSGQLFVNGTSGNVGIGTASPSEELHVSDSVDGSILVEDTVGDNQSRVSFKTATYDWSAGIHGGDGGKFKISNHTSLGTNDYLTVTTAGNVGIGTTTPGSKLDVSGSANVSSDVSVGNNLTVTNNATVSGTLSVGTSQNFGQLTIGNNQWVTGVDSAGTAGINVFKVNTNDQIQLGSPLAIDGGFTFPEDGGLITFADLPITSASPAGTQHGYTQKIDAENVLSVYGESDGAGGVQNTRVGIGTATPTAKLDVVGDANVTNLQTGGTTRVTSSGDLNNIGNINLSGSISGGTTYSGSGDISTSGGIVSIQGAGDNYFAGNVGIGDTSPAQKLDVNGNAQIQGDLILNNGTNTGTLTLGSLSANQTYVLPDSDGADEVCLVDLGNCAGSGSGITGSGTDNQVAIFNGSQSLDSSSGLTFDGTDFNVGSGQLFVNGTSGNVGIGTTSPTEALTVDGTRPITLDSTSGDVRIQGPSSGWAFEYGATGNSGTDHGGFGFHGSADSLTKYYIGPSHTSPHVSVLSSGNVGIGTVSPSAALQVANGELWLGEDGATAGKITLRDSGSVGNEPEIFTDAGGNLTLKAHSADADLLLQYGSSGGSQVTLDGASGNVGIGTTSPSAKLDIGGANPSVRLISSSNSSYYTLFNQNFADQAFNIDVGGTKILKTYGFNDADELGIGVAGHEDAAYIDTSGNVGIGTTSPSEILSAAGTVQAGSAYTETDTLVDADGSSTTNAGSAAAISENATLTAVEAADELCTNSLTNPTNVFIDDSGGTDCDVDDAGTETAILGSVPAGDGNTGTAEATAVTNQWAMNEDATSDGAYTDGDDLYIDTFPTLAYNSGSVGIGTTSPGSIGGQSLILDAQGYVGANGLRLNGSDTSNTILNTASALSISNQNASGHIALKTGSSPTERVRIDSAGNVGIGTTSPSAKLQVESSLGTTPLRAQINGGDTSPTEVARFNISGSGAQKPYLSVTSNGTVGAKIGHQDGFGTLSIDHNYSSANNIIFKLRDSEKLRIQNDGNVGIGTTNPSALLDVAGDAEINGTLNVVSNSSSFDFRGFNSTLDSDIASLMPGTSSGSLLEAPVNAHSVIGLRENGGADGFAVVSGGGDYDTDTTYDTPVFYAGANGNVGIGTTSPANTLDVNGGIDANSLNTGQGDNNLYAMNQHVRTSDNVTFNQAQVSNLLQGDLAFSPGTQGAGSQFVTGFQNEIASWDSRGGTITTSTSGTASISDAANAVHPERSGSWSSVTGMSSGDTATYEFTGLGTFDVLSNRSWGTYLQLRAGQTPSSIQVELQHGDGTWTTVWNDASPEYNKNLWIGGMISNPFGDNTDPKGVRFTLTYSGTNNSYVEDLALYHRNRALGTYVYPFLHGDNTFTGTNTFDGTINTALTQGSVAFAGASGALSEDNTNFFWDDTNNRLGIGTNSPGAKLDVAGNIQVTSDTYGFQSSTGNATYGFSSSGTSLALTSNNSSSIDIDNNNSATNKTFDITHDGGVSTLLRVQESGNVGIGTNSPSNLLSINTTGVSSGISLDGGNALTGTTSNGWLRLNQSGSFANGVFTPGDFRTDGVLKVGSSGGRFIVNTSGNAGINTGSPLARLDINQNGSGQPALLLRNGDGSAGGDNDVQLRFGYNGTNNYGHFITTRHDSTGTHNAIDFYVSDGTQSGTYPTNAVHNLSLYQGNVGIGATNPAQDLQVKGSGGTPTIRVGAAGHPSVELMSTNANIRASYKILDSAGTEQFRLGTSNDTSNWRFTSNNNWPFLFEGGDVGIRTASPNNPLTVSGNADVTGNLGIGTPSPGDKLDVLGGATIENNAQDQNVLRVFHRTNDPNSPAAILVAGDDDGEDVAFEVRGNSDGSAVDTTENTQSSTDMSVQIWTDGDINTIGTIDAGDFTCSNCIDAAALGANSVDSSELVNGSVDESHLNASNAPTSGQVLSYDGATGFTWVTDDTNDTDVSSLNNLNGALTLQGTTNQISVTEPNASTITLSTPQDIATASSPTFGGLTVNGNVGIGTSNPNAALQFSNVVANRRIVLYENANNDHQYYGFGINSSVLRYQTAATSADHVFYAGSGTSSSNELLRIEGTGNIGIGTASPGAALQVANGELWLGEDGTTAGKLTLRDSGGVSNEPEIFTDTGGNLTLKAHSADADLALQYGSNAAYQVTLDGASGNVGIGTTSPSDLLHVKGSTFNSTSSWDLENASYNSKNHDVSNEEAFPDGVVLGDSGNKMYVVGSGATVYEYSLSTPWDITTASFTAGDSFSVSGEESGPRGLAFKDDGTEMYVVGGNSDTVYQYNLSTAWDITSASFTSGDSFGVSSEDTNPYGVTFGDSGNKMYIAGNNNDNVYQYNLSTAWDITSASFTSGDSFDVSGQESGLQSVFLKDDGKKMYIVGINSDSVHQYSLPTAWDITTASYDSVSFDVSSEMSSPHGLNFGNGGENMYVVNTNPGVVYQYSTSVSITAADGALVEGTVCVKAAGGSATCPDLKDGSIAAEGSISANAFDIAELYGSNQKIGKGMIVSADPDHAEYVTKAEAGSSVLGVTSTKPGFVLGWRSNPELAGAPHKLEVALSGRVPVKATDENGQIKPGDQLTLSSDKPGFAAKATEDSTTVIGTALSSLTSSQGQVMVFVNVDHRSPSLQRVAEMQLQNGDSAEFSDLNVSGPTTLNQLTVEQATVNSELLVNGKLTVKEAVVKTSLSVKGHIISKGKAIEITSKQGLGKDEVDDTKTTEELIKTKAEVNGTDSAGTIKLKSGLEPSDGALAQATFNKAYNTPPKVLVTAKDKNGALLAVYVQATKDGFTLHAAQKPDPDQTYTFNYFIIGSEVAQE